MKRYQALILGALISTGSFVLGMNSITTIKICDGPFDATSSRFVEYDKKDIPEKEDRQFDEIINRYNIYNRDQVSFKKEEIELKDSEIIDTIRNTNRIILKNDRNLIYLECAYYEVTFHNKFEIIPELLKYDSNTIKAQGVKNICESVGVKL